MLRICNQISWLEIVVKKCLKNMEHWDLTIFFFFFLKCPIKIFRLKDFKKFPSFNRSGSEWTECSFLRRVGVFGSTAIPSFSFSCLYSVNVEFPWVSKHVIGLKKCKKKTRKSQGLPHNYQKQTEEKANGFFRKMDDHLVHTTPNQVTLPTWMFFPKLFFQIIPGTNFG